MKVSFYLKRPNSQTETTLFARVSYNAFKLKYYLPDRINPKFWNSKTHRAKQSLKFAHYQEFNLHLDNIKNDIENIFRTYVNDNGIVPLPETLKEQLDKKIKKVESSANRNFFEFFDYIIEQTEQGVRTHPKTGNPITKVTIRTYNTTRNHLREFQKTYRRKIDFMSIDLDFYYDYLKYLMGIGLANNTIGKHIQIIKMLLNEATERGIETNGAHRSQRFKVIREKSESIYLSEDEIRQIENLDLSKHRVMDIVRDYFIIGCRTGLRHSDYSDLKPQDFSKDGYLEREQRKQKAPL